VRTGTTSDEAIDVAVVMRNTNFDPAVATVRVGGTVEWVNEDGFDHDVTSARFNDGATRWEFSETLASGGSATYTFEEGEVNEYYCTIHGRERTCGKVRTGGSSIGGSLPCVATGDGGDSGGPYRRRQRPMSILTA
jgi:plastocyanin